MKKLSLLTIIILIRIVAFSQSITLTLEQYGAKSDGIESSDGAINAGDNIFTSPGSAFSDHDIGKTIYIAGAAESGNTLIASIVSVNSPHSVKLNINAKTSVTNEGFTFGTDCSEAFIQFNKAARADKNVILNLKPGTYLTSFNNWIAGIKNLTVNGNGCKIICTHGAIDPNGSPHANAGLYTPSCFDNVDNNYYTNKYISNTSYGYKIQTVAKGTKNIKMTRGADISNFRSGDWVLVYGLHHEDFGGFPPDPRYFEYARVQNTDNADGIIHLDRRLLNNYDSEWPDGLNKGGVGAPRIIDLDRDDFTIIENLNLNHINFAPFNGWTGKLAHEIRNGRFELYGFINAKISNLTAPAAYLGNGKNLLIDETTFYKYCEPDKVLDSTVIKNSSISRMTNAGGLNTLRLINSTFTTTFNASPRILYLNGDTFDCVGTTSESLISVGFNKGTDSVVVGTNTWICTRDRHALFAPPNSIIMTVGNVINNRTVTVQYSSFVQNKNSRQVVPGSVGYTADGNKFEVTKVNRFDDDNIAVSGNFSSAPKIGDKFVFSLVPNIKVIGKQIKKGEFANHYNLFQSIDKTIKLTYDKDDYKN
jgi:hypothetical protein